MDKDELDKEIKKVSDEISQEKEQAVPYWVLENDYWRRSREVCVVDGINCLENEDAEIICGLNPRDEQWVRNLAGAYGFSVERYEMKDSLGRFIKLIVRKKGEKDD